MTEIYASCVEGLPAITPDQFCNGFGGCDNPNGLQATAENIDAMLQALQKSVLITGTAFNHVTQTLTITYADGHSDVVPLPGIVSYVESMITVVQGQINDLETSTNEAINELKPRIGDMKIFFGASWPGEPGWQIADGTNGTPNFQGNFPMGVSALFPVGSIGGSASHSHGDTGSYTLTESNLPAHSHFIFANSVSDTPITADPNGSAAYDTTNSPGEPEYTITTGGSTPATLGKTAPAGGSGSPSPHSHTTSSASSMPPFVSVFFLIYVGI